MCVATLSRPSQLKANLLSSSFVSGHHFILHLKLPAFIYLAATSIAMATKILRQVQIAEAKSLHLAASGRQASRSRSLCSFFNLPLVEEEEEGDEGFPNPI